MPVVLLLVIMKYTIPVIHDARHNDNKEILKVLVTNVRVCFKKLFEL